MYKLEQLQPAPEVVLAPAKLTDQPLPTTRSSTMQAAGATCTHYSKQEHPNAKSRRLGMLNNVHLKTSQAPGLANF
jgi:hypothetical protein